MSHRSSIALIGLLACVSAAPATQPVLHVYGPGGPLGPLRECGEAFGKDHGCEVDVVAGPEAKWADAAGHDADLVFGGAEYMLTTTAEHHPGLIDESTRTDLWDRPAGILVRPGNPKHIASMADLAKQGVQIVDVNGAGQFGLWEDMAGRTPGLIAAIRRNVAVTVQNSAEAIDVWNHRPQIDAWVTYESWHKRLPKQTDLVQVPDAERVYRGTPIAIAKPSKHPDLARQFIAFMQSDPGHNTFRRWGWR